VTLQNWNGDISTLESSDKSEKCKSEMSPIDAENGGADEDRDEDGSSNYAEYIAGTDPSDINSVFAFQSVEVSEDCVLTWSSATGKVYSLWDCTNLVSGEFSITNSPVPSTPPLNTFTTGMDNAECVFYRLTVEDE